MKGSGNPIKITQKEYRKYLESLTIMMQIVNYEANHFTINYNEIAEDDLFSTAQIIMIWFMVEMVLKPIRAS